MALKKLTISLLILASIGFCFDPCKFNFGKGWTYGTNLTGVDFASIYAGNDGSLLAGEKGDGYNESHHGVFLQETKAANVTPMLYGYLTAFMARQEYGLYDCDLGLSPNLCQNGSDFIRAHRAEILARYTLYSKKIAEIWGPDAAPIWIVEPDLYQYSASGSAQRKAYNGQEQVNGGIPDADIALFFKDIVTQIRSHTPKAQVAIDISPWMNSPVFYYSKFDKSIINYAATSGGRTQAASTKIRSGDVLTWAKANFYTEKPILADCGYGSGGLLDGHHSEWDVLSNIKARITDGVISINQFDARADWSTAVLSSLRAQIPNWCPLPIQGNTPVPKNQSLQGKVQNGLLELWNVEPGAMIEIFDSKGQLLHREWGQNRIQKTKLAPTSGTHLLVRQTGNSIAQSVSVPVIP